MNDWFFVSVDLELTNICKNRCLFCPHDNITRPQGMMARDTFKRVAELLAGEQRLITLSGIGDPLMHPDLLNMISTLREMKSDVGIVVNPASLNIELIDGLINSRPNVINISFPSIKKDVFEKLCPEIEFNHALELTRILINKSKGKVGIRIFGILTEINSDEAESFFRYWQLHGNISTKMSKCHGRGGNLNVPGIYTPYSSAESLRQCGLFAFHTFIAWNGDVPACCHDLTGETGTGNILSDGIENIINEKRKILSRLRMFDLCKKCDEPLRTCNLPTGNPPETRRERNKFFRKLSLNVQVP